MIGRFLLGNGHGDGRVDVLARAQRPLHQRTVRPALGEDRDGVDVGGQESSKLAFDPGQVVALRQPLRPAR